MESPSIDILAWWRHLEKMILENSVTPIEQFYLQQLFDDAMHEKDGIETEQIIARVMYKPCFSHKEENGQISVGKKFRYLKQYYWEMQNFNTFGLVVMSSIIREWPVPIFSADQFLDKQPDYIWDRAPISIASKDGSIRKDGDQYVIRVLALEESDIGSILVRAISSTQLMFIDENGQENATSAYIIELNREGGDGTKKKETSFTTPQGRKGKASRSLKSREDTQSPLPPSYFDNGFENLPGNNGTTVFVPRHGKSLSDYVAKESKNVMFSITNISIIDPKVRTKITQKYLLKTDFEFLFMHSGGAFTVRSAGYYPTVPSEYPMVSGPLSSTIGTVRSMPFEVSSNASTHWKKSFSGIWANLFLYYSKLGELTPYEIEKGRSNKENEGVLAWGRVKEMVKHFISCRSENHVRPLSDTEMRTITRMIFARRLSDYNEILWDKYTKKKQRSAEKAEWIIDKLPQKDKDEIQDLILRKRIKIPSEESLNLQTVERKTFTQLLNSEMQSVQMKDDYLVKESDFTNDLLVLSGSEPEEASCNIHSWLHSVAEMIAGQTLHLSSPKTTIRMFNNNLITLRSAESAKRTVKNIISLVKSGKKSADDGANVLMIRIDEREEFRLLFEMIDPGAPEDPYHFGYYNAKAIKEMKIPLNKQLIKPEQEAIAIRDGVVNKKKELCGLFAVLKTGYLSDFHKISVSSEGKLHIYPIFKSADASTPVYPYDFTPADMVNNEINPLIGPKRFTNIVDPNVEIYSEIDSTITPSMKSMGLNSQHNRRVQQSQQPMQQIQKSQPPQMVPQHTFAAPYTPPQFQQQPSPQFAYPMQPPMQPINVNNYVQNVHNIHYDGAPPPYSSQSDIITYANQGVQAQQPFTPPGPVNEIDSLVGINNPNFQML